MQNQENQQNVQYFVNIQPRQERVSNKIWQEVENPEEFQDEEPLLKVVLKEQLMRENNKICSVFIAFFPDHIVKYMEEDFKTPVAKIPFEFDLRLEWIMKKNLGIKFGFSLFKKRNEDLVVFYANDSILNLKIYPVIQLKLNQANFHENYKAYKKIGKGNFASVYLVEHKISKQKYAVKAFSKEVSYQQKLGKEAIMNEINIMKELLNNHNIIKLLEVFETDNSIYMIMDHLEGGSLLDYLRKEGKLQEGVAKNILHGLLSAVTYMDANKIIHRDIKPENILFKSSWNLENPYLVDFGLATHYLQSTHLFNRCGTPGYVAPEIANLNSKETQQSSKVDVFSVGVIMHSILLGKLLFKGEDYNQILQLNKQCKVDHKASTYESLSSHSRDLMFKLLEKDPANRPSAAEALSHPFFKQLSEENSIVTQHLSNKETPENQFYPNNLRKSMIDSCGTFKIQSNILGQNSSSQAEGYGSQTSHSKLGQPGQPSVEQMSSKKISLNAKLLRYEEKQKEQLDLHYNQTKKEHLEQQNDEIMQQVEKLTLMQEKQKMEMRNRNFQEATDIDMSYNNKDSQGEPSDQISKKKNSLGVIKEF